MRFRVVVGIGVLFAGALLLPSTAEAQGGTISGLVSDSTGGILSGVTVEATSPVMIERTLTAITDGSGRYTIVNLRPGAYAITFSLQGFNKLVRGGIQLTGESAIQVNVQM